MRRLAKLTAAGVLVLHLAGGGAALALLPRGFAGSDIHLWSNTIIPAVACAAVIAAFIAAAFSRAVAGRAVSLLVAAAAGGWAAALVTGAALFSASMTLVRLAGGAVIALALLALAWAARDRTSRSLAAAFAGAALGVVVILAQRAPLPSTHPLGGSLADVQGNDGSASDDVVVRCGTHQLRVAPLLTFESRSPDRTWTLLAPAGSFGPHRTLVRHATTPDGFRAAYTDDGASTLVVHQDAAGVDLDAVSVLAAPVYSHLNSFTAIYLSFDATIAFGPTGATRFPIEPADYPSGRPTKLAYLDAALAFHVARSSDAEKGPYSELAAGHLDRGAPLVIELRAREGDGCRLTFQDWASQVSTGPSPTAGWGVPQGSIQFFSGLVLLTLADTGPGRGFDSVGHAAGTYRNRVHIESFE